MQTEKILDQTLTLEYQDLCNSWKQAQIGITSNHVAGLLQAKLYDLVFKCRAMEIELKVARDLEKDMEVMLISLQRQSDTYALPQRSRELLAQIKAQEDHCRHLRAENKQLANSQRNHSKWLVKLGDHGKSKEIHTIKQDLKVQQLKLQKLQERDARETHNIIKQTRHMKQLEQNNRKLQAMILKLGINEKDFQRHKTHKQEKTSWKKEKMEAENNLKALHLTMKMKQKQVADQERKLKRELQSYADMERRSQKAIHQIEREIHHRQRQLKSLGNISEHEI